MAELEEKIQECEPSLGERYNEYKVQQGLQDRIEDAPLPETLEDEGIYEDWKEKHVQQKKATEEREKRAKRRMELMEMRDDIVRIRERAKQLEWQAEIRIQEKALENNEMMIAKKKKEIELKKRQAEQARIYEELQKEEQRMGENPLRNGQTALHNSFIEERQSATRALFTQVDTQLHPQRGVMRHGKQNNEEVTAWVHMHSHHSQQSQHGNNMQEVDMDNLQKHANRIVEDKHKNRSELERLVHKNNRCQQQ